MAESEILKREELGSTGIGGGVAIPHARMQDVKKPLGILARLNTAVAFDAVDGQLVDLVFLLMLPALPQPDQLNALAAVPRKLRDKDLVGSLRGAKSAAELFAAIIAE